MDERKLQALPGVLFVAQRRGSFRITCLSLTLLICEFVAAHFLFMNASWPSAVALAALEATAFKPCWARLIELSWPEKCRLGIERNLDTKLGFKHVHRSGTNNDTSS